MTLVGKGKVQASILWISLLFMTDISARLFSLDGALIKPKISVVPAVNAAGQDELNAGARILFETLEQTLQQSGSVQTVSWAGSALDILDVEALASEAGKQLLDNIVLIRLEKAPSAGKWETVVCRISVFDRSQGKVTIDKGFGPARLRGFLNASNKTVSSVLSELTGTPVGFGVIDLDNMGEKGTYEILLDRRVVPEAQLAIVAGGSHELVIRQKRLLGDVVLVSTTLQVHEGKTSKVTFSVPFLTAEEQFQVDVLAKAVEELWNEPDAGARMDKALADQESFFDDICCSPRLAILRKAAEDTTSQWRSQQETLREQTFQASLQPMAPLASQRRILSDQKLSMEAQRKWFAWTSLGGWVATGVSAGIVGYSWFSANAALTSYNSSTTQSGWDKARDQMKTANLVFSLGLGVGITGLAVGITSLFLEPDVSNVDKQIREVDRKISLLGAQE